MLTFFESYLTMKKLISALVLSAVSFGAFAAEPAKAPVAAAAVQGQPAPMTPEQFDKTKTFLLERHTLSLKVLAEGERCLKGAKGEEDLRKCMEAERNALMPKVQPAPQAAPVAPKAAASK